MKVFLNNKFLIQEFTKFLFVESIEPFKLSNKKIEYLLDPEKNMLINKKFYDEVQKQFYNMKEKREEDLDNFDYSWKSEVNWEKYYKQMIETFKAFKDESILDKIKSTFRLPYFLCDLRKDNYILEFDTSDVYLDYCYDQKRKERCKFNFYSYSIKPDFLDNKNEEIEILKPNCCFEKEFQNIRENYLNEIKNNDNYKIILKKIINYEFEDLEKIFEYVIHNKIEDKINKIIFFVLWINKCFILNCQYVVGSINILANDNNTDKFYKEYYMRINECINTLLRLNEIFENVNLIINYWWKFSTNEQFWEKQEKFSLFNLFMSIYKKNVYEKLFPISKERINLTKTLEYYYNMTDINDESDTNDSDYDMESEEEDKTENEKDYIEEVYLISLYSEINGNNANFINHSELKISKFLQQIENIYQNQVEEFVKSKIEKNENLEKIFKFVEDAFKTRYITRTSKLKIDKSLKLLNRTKKILIQNVIKNIVEYAQSLVSEDFKKFINSNIRNTYQYHQNEDYYNLEEFSPEESMKIQEKVKEELNNIKMKIYDDNIGGYELNELINIVNAYINSSNSPLIKIIKKILYFYYTQMTIYGKSNKRIEKIMSNVPMNEIKIIPN